MALKKLEKIIAAPPAHWVGDGFLVNPLRKPSPTQWAGGFLVNPLFADLA